MQVATASDGRSIAVWIHGNGTYNTVYARQIAPDGALGPVIPGLADLASAGYDANRVQVAMDPEGDATLVWGWQDGDGTERVQTRRIAADGTVGPTDDVTASAAVQMAPQVVTDGDGVATIVYRQLGSGGTTIWATRVAADGTLGAPRQLSASPGFGDSAAVGLDSQGRATVAWVFTAGGSSVVQSLRIAADGTIGATHDLSAPATGVPDGPRIAMAGDGSATVAWARYIRFGDSPVQVVRIAEDGTVGSVLDISRAGADADQPRLAADDDGDTTLTWTSVGAGSVRTAKIVRLSADGTLGTVFDLATPAAGGSSPDVAVDPSGAATTIWVQQNSGDLVQARSMSAGGVLGTTIDLSQAGVGEGLPKVAVDPRGNAIVVWEYNSTSVQMALSERGFLRAVSSVSPASDSGLFNLQLDGLSLATNVGDGGNTGLWAFPADVPTRVGETAAAPTILSDYATTIACRDDDGAGSVVASAQNAGPLDVTLGDAEQVRCDVGNTHIVPPPPPRDTTPAPATTASTLKLVRRADPTLTTVRGRLRLDTGHVAVCPAGATCKGKVTLKILHRSRSGKRSVVFLTGKAPTTTLQGGTEQRIVLTLTRRGTRLIGRPGTHSTILRSLFGQGTRAGVARQTELALASPR